jgi:hypothetical protein
MQYTQLMLQSTARLLMWTKTLISARNCACLFAEWRNLQSSISNTSYLAITIQRLRNPCSLCRQITYLYISDTVEQLNTVATQRWVLTEGGPKPEEHPLSAVRDCLFNPLNAELNPTCHLLVLLRAHHILHVSRIRVNVSRAARHSWRPSTPHTTRRSAMPRRQCAHVT